MILRKENLSDLMLTENEQRIKIFLEAFKSKEILICESVIELLTKIENSLMLKALKSLEHKKKLTLTRKYLNVPHEKKYKKLYSLPAFLIIKH